MMTVDLCFPLVGASVPRDHGYLLYAAVARRIPSLHEARWFGIHPIGGRVTDDRVLIGPRGELRLRLPAEQIPIVLPLAGECLDIGGSVVQIGAPVVQRLMPGPALDARLVLLKLTRPPVRENRDLGREVLDNVAIAERYRTELGRQLAAMGVTAHIELCGRRSMAIKGKRLLGYSVRLTGLDADASLRVQVNGLGGRRAMGCGIFRPTRGRRMADPELLLARKSTEPRAGGRD